MGKSARAVLDQRLQAIHKLAEGPLTLEGLRSQLHPHIERRAFMDMMSWLRRYFPENLLRQKAKSLSDGGRITYQWTGPTPTVLKEPLLWLAQDELIALAAARSFLRDPDSKKPATASRNDKEDGDLLAKSLTPMLPRSRV